MVSVAPDEAERVEALNMAMKKVAQRSVRISNPTPKNAMEVSVPGCHPMLSSAGTGDTVEVVRNGKHEVIIVSKNSEAGYVCCELFDPEGGGKPDGMAFSQDKEEIKKVLGNPFSKSSSASSIAKKMRKFAV